MAEKVVIELLDSDDDGPVQPGQTKANAITLDADEEIAPAPATNPISSNFATSHFIDQLPHTQPHAALAHQRLPTMNGVLPPAPTAAAHYIIPREINALPQPALPYYQSPKPERPIESFFTKNIPLPKFHEMPAQKAKPKAVTPKSKLASRPHAQSSVGSPRRSERKRMRLCDRNVSKAPSSGSSRHEGAERREGGTPPSSYPNLEQSTAAQLGSGHNRESPRARGLNRDQIQRSSSTPGILIEGTSTGSKKRIHSSLTDDDMFPLEASIGKEKLRDISSDVRARLADTAANKTIRRILVAAKSLSDLADRIIDNFTESENKALAQEIKADFDKSFKDLQEEHGNSYIPDERKACWLAATVYHGITFVGRLGLPNRQPMPERDISACQQLNGMLTPGNEKAIQLVEEEDEDVDMIKEDAPRRRPGDYIKKAAQYRDVDVLRLKGMAGRERRPYMAKDYMNSVKIGAKESTSATNLKARYSKIISVPFAAEEIAAVRAAVTKWYNAEDSTTQDMDNVFKVGHDGHFLSRVASYVASNILYNPKRQKEFYHEFLRDFDTIAMFLGMQQNEGHDSKPIALVRKCITRVTSGNAGNSTSIQAIMRNRDVAANMDRATQKLQSLVLGQLDDSFVRDLVITDGPGDMASFLWLSEDEFICSAITNCDLYNQDYNKPGNLIIGSTGSKIVKAVVGHRIPRPLKPQKPDTVVVESQDPWLYCSVPMIAFDARRQLCFTASYDKTVKIWRTLKGKLTMELLGTWKHDGHVNLVATSPHHSKVATASDVKMNGIRVYDLDRGDLDSISPCLYSGSRAREVADRKLTWAYYPSTMQWGMSQAASRFIAVGYSPRSFEVHSDVPWDKKNSGQLCAWDTLSKSEVTIAGPKAQNVFEVVWHPSQVVFVAATAAAGDFDEGVRTQLRLFVYKDATRAFAAVKTFECLAADINEITLRPSSYKEIYLTASCTDRKTYVWDSKQGEKPTHILEHDEPVDQIDERQDAEEVDAGVKFAAWGRTADRFFTGSSDGVVKAWNIRAPPGQAYLGDLLFASGGISCGLFSPDRTRLAIGDTSGKIHMMKIWDQESEPRPIRAEVPIRPFYEPAQPVTGGFMRAREFMVKRQLLLHTDKYIGAVQGPNYASTGLYRTDRHPGGNLHAMPEDVLRGQSERKHRENLIVSRLPSVKDVQQRKSQAGMIFSKLCVCGFEKEDARVVAHHCGGMEMDLTACSELFKQKMEIHVPLPDSYEPEAEGVDPFLAQHGSSISSDGGQKQHYLCEHEISQFWDLKNLITCESVTRQVFEQVEDDLDA